MTERFMALLLVAVKMQKRYMILGAPHKHLRSCEGFLLSQTSLLTESSLRSGAKVTFWRQDRAIGNFGDALSLLYMKRIFKPPCAFESGIIHLVGSVIAADHIDRYLQGEHKVHGADNKVVFWACGKRDSAPLTRQQRAGSTILGIRGVLSRTSLDMPYDTPLGDSALLLPRFYRPANDTSTAGKVLWVPHVHSVGPTFKDLDEVHNSVVMRPEIPNDPGSCEAFINAIASANFVMANAMHAAVVALAYGTPFAFWAANRIDVPFKWADFSSGVGFQMPFSESYSEGLSAFESVRPDRAFATARLEALLSVAPYALRDHVAT